jgi:hypothetical protein
VLWRSRALVHGALWGLVSGIRCHISKEKKSTAQPRDRQRGKIL